ncbi:MAG: hypothetical protein EPN85_10105 [Bacteroidetes bacterium]|nr:MAG: hypothetical protein EPN85_10105 [Bacteroidota bacterium]
MQKQFPFFVFTTAILVALILPTLLQDGMFMDGLLYASVSKNLADGISSFWFPHFSKTLHPFFDQQPPLGFGIQALFFKMFGGSMYVERGYSFLTALINAALIAVLWGMIFKNEREIKKLSWLPVLFWITIPVCFWAYSNNVLENTLSVFDLLAVIFIVRFFQTSSFLLIILSGIFIFLASLTKGIQGMFPLIAFLGGWAVNFPFEGGSRRTGSVAHKNISFRETVFYSLLLFLVPFTIYFILLQNNTIFQSLSAYLHNRVLNSIQNVVAVENRFYLIYRLFLELMPMMALSIMIVLLMRKQKKEEVPVPFFKKQILFFLLTGVSASFPLIVTLEQRGFYLVTSFPYFAIAMAAVSAPYVSVLIGKINIQSRLFKIFRLLSFLLLIGSLIFSFLQTGKASRDKDTLHDVHLIGRIVSGGVVVGATPALWRQWSFQEYLIRHYYICLDSRIKRENDYVILESGTAAPDSINIEKVNIPTIRYHLYKVKK